jgi:hypothetical protein
MKTVEDEYQSVKGDSKKSCASSAISLGPCSPGQSWGLPAMAKKAGYGLEHRYYNAYATPTRQAHSAVLSVTSRVNQAPDGRYFDNSIQKVYAGLPMMTAHVVMLKMLRVETRISPLV